MSALSSGPNKSSKEVLDFRRRVFLAEEAVRRVLRVGVGDSVAGLREVLRVLRTGVSSVVGATAVRRVFRAGPGGSWVTFASLVEVVGRAPGRPPGGAWREGVDDGG